MDDKLSLAGLLETISLVQRLRLHNNIPAAALAAQTRGVQTTYYFERASFYNTIVYHSSPPPPPRDIKMFKIFLVNVFCTIL